MKTKLKMRKMLSLFITLIMLGTMLPANFAFAEMPNDPNEPNDPDEMKSYIVVTDSDGTFSDVFCGYYRRRRHNRKRTAGGKSSVNTSRSGFRGGLLTLINQHPEHTALTEKRLF